jgi:hypothetical protein
MSNRRPELLESPLSFKLWPGKTFFGLDRNKAHCFTLMGSLFFDYCSVFNLALDSKIVPIIFVINHKEYPSELRLVLQNRTRLRKLERSDLPMRELISVQWKKFGNTILALKELMPECYNDLLNGIANQQYSISFRYIGNNRFQIDLL